MSEEIPSVVEDLALGGFRLVKEKLGMDLDFSPETLPILDHYLIALRGEENGLDEKTLGLLGPCVGAYFGEVARRSLPGLRWRIDEDDYQRWRLESSGVFVCFNPIGAALEAALGESVTGWNAHFTLLPEDRVDVDRSLNATGGVRAEDYYRLAIRHEVLEQTIALLISKSESGSGTPRRFGPDAYASILDGASGGVEA